MGYIEDLRAEVGHRPLILTGSLVLGLNEKEQILLQKRRWPNGFWGIPGGLMELGETTEQTAQRELFEETGLTVNKLDLFGVYTKTAMTHLDNGDVYMGVSVVYSTHDFSGEMKIDPEESYDFAWFDFGQLPADIADFSRKILADAAEKFCQR